MNDLYRNIATNIVMHRKLTLENVAYRVCDVTQLKAAKRQINSGAQNPHGHLHAKNPVDPGCGSTNGIDNDTEATSDPLDRPPRDAKVMGAPQPMSFFRGRAKGKARSLFGVVPIASNEMSYAAAPLRTSRSTFRRAQSNLFRSPSGAREQEVKP